MKPFKIHNDETDTPGKTPQAQYSEQEVSVSTRAAEKAYHFYGWHRVSQNILALYDDVKCAWCAETCAPRMRENWTRENQTLGQCSITAFLAQDIFGGKVYGILREGGNYHCYNVVGDCVFDLTSEQFGEEKLCYENNPEQFREVHWQKEEKHQRYNYLKAELLKKLEEL